MLLRSHSWAPQQWVLQPLTTQNRVHAIEQIPVVHPEFISFVTESPTPWAPQLHKSSHTFPTLGSTDSMPKEPPITDGSTPRPKPPNTLGVPLRPRSSPDFGLVLEMLGKGLKAVVHHLAHLDPLDKSHHFDGDFHTKTKHNNINSPDLTKMANTTSLTNKHPKDYKTPTTKISATKKDDK